MNPTRKDIENLLQKLNKTQGATKNDQKFLMVLTEQLKAEGHFVYYQAYQSGKVCKFVLHEMIMICKFVFSEAETHTTTHNSG